MRRSRKTDFQKLKIILVGSTYPSQRPQCPSLSNMFSCVCMFVTHSFSTRATGTTTNNNLTLASNWLYPLVTASVHDIGPSRPISLKKCNKQSINESAILSANNFLKIWHAIQQSRSLISVKFHGLNCSKIKTACFPTPETAPKHALLSSFFLTVKGFLNKQLVIPENVKSNT